MEKSLLALRSVKYRSVRSLFGKRISVSRLDQIERDVLDAVAPDAPGDFRPRSSLNNIELVLAKYGFVDLEFVVPEDFLTSADRITRAGIRELGYSPRPANRESEGRNGDDGNRSCLEILTNSVKEETYLRLFLNSDYSKDAMARIFDELKQQPSTGIVADERVTAAVFAVAEKLKKTFPVTFTIEDACLTNSAAIWLAKHVYL